MKFFQTSTFGQVEVLFLKIILHMEIVLPTSSLHF